MLPMSPEVNWGLQHNVWEWADVEAIETRKRSYLKDFVSLPDSAEALFTGAETGARACGSIKAHFHGHQKNLCSEPCNTEIKSVLSLLFSSWAFTCCIFFLTSGAIVVFQRSTNSQKGDLHRTYLLRYQNSSALHFMHYYWYVLFSREIHVAKAFKPSSSGLNWAFHEPKWSFFHLPLRFTFRASL